VGRLQVFQWVDCKFSSGSTASFPVGRLQVFQWVDCKFSSGSNASFPVGRLQVFQWVDCKFFSGSTGNFVPYSCHVDSSTAYRVLWPPPWTCTTLDGTWQNSHVLCCGIKTVTMRANWEAPEEWEKLWGLWTLYSSLNVVWWEIQ
jgi:hypothetical protein